MPGGSTGPTVHPFKRDVLGTCATVADFEHYLDSTNVTGRQTQTNIAVIDADGAAAIFETGGSVYWKFDANNSTVAPDGYILRTNFSINGGGSIGIERYNRAVKLVGDFYTGDSLNYKSILRYQMRDFSDIDSSPFAVPYPHQMFIEVPFGYIYTNTSICNSSSVSASVIQGVLPGETAMLSTLWTLLGQPASTIAVPYWPIGNAPVEANGLFTAPLCDVAIQIKSLLFIDEYIDVYGMDLDFIDTYMLLAENGEGLWALTFAAEDSIFVAADSLLEHWRTDSLIVEEMLTAENIFASYALLKTKQAYDFFSTYSERLPTEFTLSQNYPNPFNPITKIQYSIPHITPVKIIIFNTLGQKIKVLVNKTQNRDVYEVIWDGTTDSGNRVSSGVYFYRIQTQNFVKTNKMILVR